MGIETAIIASVVLAGASAVQTMGSAKKAANAAVEEGNLAIAQKSKETKIRASNLKTSFLNSGLTLEGTPNTILEDTFSTGFQDIGQIATNYNRKSKSIISSARNEVIKSFSSLATSFAMGSMNAPSSGVGATAPTNSYPSFDTIPSKPTYGY